MQGEEVNPLPDDVIDLGVNQFLEAALFCRLQRWATTPQQFGRLALIHVSVELGSEGVARQPGGRSHLFRV